MSGFQAVPTEMERLCVTETALSEPLLNADLSTDPSTWDEKPKRVLEATFRNVAFLHSFAATTPCAFVIRYIDSDFIHTYLKLRPKWTLLKMFANFVFLIFFPFVYSRYILDYPCEGETMLVNQTTATVRLKSCEVQDWLRSVWSLMLGPGCMVFCLLATWLMYRSDWSAAFFVRCVLLPLRRLLPDVMYNGLGPRLTRGGTGGLCAENLAARADRAEAAGRKAKDGGRSDAGAGDVEKADGRAAKDDKRDDKQDDKAADKVSWCMHDCLGTPDIFFLVCVMNLSICVALLAAPAVVAWYHGIGVGKGIGVGASLALISGRVLFAAANFIFGAPPSLVSAVHTKMALWKPCAREPRDTFVEAVTFLKGRKEDKLGVLCGLANKFETEVHEQPSTLSAFRSLKVADGEACFAAPAAFNKLFACCGPTLCLSAAELDSLSQLNPTGVVLGYMDPGYKILSQFLGFQKTLPIQEILVVDQRWRSHEAAGVWEVAGRVSRKG